MEENGDTVASEKASFAYTLDNDPIRHRVGIITLSTDYLIEGEFASVVPLDQVSIHATRIRATNPLTLDNLRLMEPQLTAAAALMPAGVDVVAYNCTSGTVAMGEEIVAERVHAGCPDVPIATPIGGAVDAMRCLGLERITLVTPYSESVSRYIGSFLEARGIVVLNIASFCLEDDYDMFCLPPPAIRRLAREATRAEAQGVFVACTGIRSLEVVQGIEDDLEKPAVSATQALIWSAIRSAGFDRSIEGYGRLLRL